MSDQHSSGETEGLDQCPVCRSRLVSLYEKQTGLFAVGCDNDGCHFTVEAYGATQADAVRQWNTRDVAQAQPKWRHLKRGSIVTEIARGFAQVAHHPIEKMTCVVIYRHDEDGHYWVRNAVEFDDGRFEAYPLPSTTREAG